VSAQVYLESAQYKPGLTEEERAVYLKKASDFCERTLRLSKKFPYIRAYSYQVNGTYLWLTGNKQEAIKTWEKGIAYLREHTKDAYRLATILLEEASCILQDIPEDKKAKEYLIEAKEIFDRLGARSDAERIKKLSGAFAPDEEIIEAREALTQRRHSESLLSVTKAIGSILNLEELLENIMDYAIKVTGAERGFLFLYGEKQEGLTIQVKRGVSEEIQGDMFSYESYMVSLEIIQESEKSDKAIIGSQVESSAATVFNELIKYGIKQAMCIPLQAREKKLGFIYIDNSLAGGIFGSEELELMKLFAVQASVSIENAYLIGNLVEQERLKQEMELGWQIQSSLLPQEAPRFKGLHAEGFMQPAKIIGGDYYDFFPITDEQGDTEKLGIVIADVSGKGIDAGMVMSMTKSYIHGLIEQCLTTREVILKMNNHLCMLLKEQKFVSMIYAEYSVQNGTFTWSGAGHKNFLIVRNRHPDFQQQENEVELITSGGIILGLFYQIDNEISQQSILLNEGDKVILYTDGVTEAKNAKNEIFTQDRLIDILKYAPPLSSRDLISYINEKIHHHIGNTPLSDDVTIVVLERKPEEQIAS
jgi:serine phosphatase RsbU (regulator of sigma subunit)